ncbi:Os06g0328850 [Oryza sativa Japonica Group]|uniref:Os06g0328850 protein n=1 Tax=Oryza sativa subsp. japonica TaxID=39947 RepID=A0A0P0WW19_ORYSJ|nr:hypothetical protein EE612_034416 [Oryza sativa]BAS97544.1 Os06g0328850 [Oryza sativa Japonica Group]
MPARRRRTCAGRPGTRPSGRTAPPPCRTDGAPACLGPAPAAARAGSASSSPPPSRRRWWLGPWRCQSSWWQRRWRGRKRQYQRWVSGGGGGMGRRRGRRGGGRGAGRGGAARAP